MKPQQILIVGFVALALVAVPHANAAVIPVDVDEGVFDGDGDEQGDGLTGLIAGDNPPGDLEFRAIFEFDITDAADKDAININALITFEVTVNVKNNDAYDVVLVGMTSGNDGVVNNSDYEAAGTILSAPASFSSVPDTFSVDVTSFAKANVGEDWLAFRIQVVDPSVVPDGNTDDPDNYHFQSVAPRVSDARLTAIPEPASLALIGLGSLLMIRRRR